MKNLTKDLESDSNYEVEFTLSSEFYDLTIEHVMTDLRTIERETAINELDLSEHKNFFDEEEQMLTSEKPSKENLMKTIVDNVLNETNVFLQEEAYDFSNDSSDER